MNKKDVVIRVSEISKIETIDCEKVIDALEQVLSDELSSSKGSAFDKIYKLMSFFKNKSVVLLMCLMFSLSTILVNFS